MPKISVRSESQAHPMQEWPEGLSGDGEVLSYFGGASDPLHLHAIRLNAAAQLAIAASGLDRMVFVWKGNATVNHIKLDAGSSVIIEHGRALTLGAGEEGATLLCFSGAASPEHTLPGGNVLILPASDAPHSDDLGSTPGLGGTMYADSGSPTNDLWLHANHFPPMEEPRPNDTAGVHSHSEDEIIFVISGDIRLGTRLHGPGTALAIAADTLYSFTPGPQGLHFINFRAGRPGDIQFASGASISETEYWREKLPRPTYLEVPA